jgi:hypothetical protein
MFDFHQCQFEWTNLAPSKKNVRIIKRIDPLKLHISL